MKITKKMWVGIVLTFALSLVSVGLATYLPKLGAESIALLLGLLLGNLVFTNKRWASGVKWSEKFPIEIGIALLGFQLTLKTIEELGWQGAVFTLVQMAIVITFIVWAGQKVFKLDLETSMLMASGNAVCGSSAIASVAPKIYATDDQRRTSVATVSLEGVLLLFVLPLLAPALYGNNDLLMGGLIGGTLQSVGQVIGAASLVNGSVVGYATLFKMLRIIMLFAIVIIMANIAHRHEESNISKAGQQDESINVFKMIPWFIYVFIGLLLLGAFVKFPSPLVNTSKQITSFFGVVNLAGIGLNLKWQTIRNSGAKLLGFGFIIIVVQVLLAIALIHFIY